MSDNRFSYSREDLVKALRTLGITRGDVVYSHQSLGRLGLPDGERSIEKACRYLFEAFQEALGPDGTILIPTYTYSIGGREVFDVANTPSTVGAFSEFFRKQPGAVRSRDPMLATSGLGPLAESILRNDLPHTCYGLGSVFERMRKNDAWVVMIGLGLHWATYRHYIEEIAGAPFRFKKLFTGLVKEGAQTTKEHWVYYAAQLIENCGPYGQRLEKHIKQTDMLRRARVGIGEINAIKCRDYYETGLRGFAKDPWLSAKGPSLTTEQIIQAENNRAGCEILRLAIRKPISIVELFEKYHSLPVHALSDGADAIYRCLGEMGFTIYELPTGVDVGNGRFVPEKWTCREASLTTISGEKIFDLKECPLHVAAYSQPFESRIGRKELMRHLHDDSDNADMVPFVDYLLDRDWALACSADQKKALADDEYQVKIDARFSFATMKMAEFRVAGKNSDSILLSLPITGPGQAVFVLSVASRLIEKIHGLEGMEYSLKLLVSPIGIGEIGYCDHFIADCAEFKAILRFDAAMDGSLKLCSLPPRSREILQGKRKGIPLEAQSIHRVSGTGEKELIQFYQGEDMFGEEIFYKEKTFPPFSTRASTCGMNNREFGPMVRRVVRKTLDSLLAI